MGLKSDQSVLVFILKEEKKKKEKKWHKNRSVKPIIKPGANTSPPCMETTHAFQVSAALRAAAASRPYHKDITIPFLNERLLLVSPPASRRL